MPLDGVHDAVAIRHWHTQRLRQAGVRPPRTSPPDLDAMPWCRGRRLTHTSTNMSCCTLAKISPSPRPCRCDGASNSSSHTPAAHARARGPSRHAPHHKPSRQPQHMTTPVLPPCTRGTVLVCTRCTRGTCAAACERSMHGTACATQHALHSMHDTACGQRVGSPGNPTDHNLLPFTAQESWGPTPRRDLM